MRGMRWLPALIVLVACGGGGGGGVTPDAAAPPVDAEPAPVLRNPLPNMTDADLATQSLQILGAGIQGAVASSCNGCHGVTKQKLRYWRALSDASLTSCLTDLSIATQESAQTMIACMREMPAVATSDYKTKNLGINATASKLPWFEFLFRRAYGDSYQDALATFEADAGMPKNGLPSMAQSQFDIVAEWFSRGLPMLDDKLTGDPPPDTCEDGISADVAAHTLALQTTGWRAVDRQNAMAMHGCGTETGRGCLTSYPLASDNEYGTTWEIANRGVIRVLADNTYVSAYWTRSSPDGRFVAHGVASDTGAMVIDLQRSQNVPVAAAYDPAFFPDMSGFVFQGGPRNACPMSVLTSNPSAVAMTETGCRKINNIGLYQHIGQGINGNTDYFVVDNEFESDEGGKEPTLKQPDASFASHGYSSFTAMVFTGTQYNVKGTVDISTPFEGDVSLSPSATLTMSRVAGVNDVQLGYVLRKVIATPSGQSYTYEAPEIGRYCFSGGKVGFSFDERYIAFHHYVTPTDTDAKELGFTGVSDPGFAAYATQGASNLYIMDLATGVRTRITNVKPGQYALYPHFRADNWIYAQVRDSAKGHEYTIATDAALVAAGE
ncbi:hypothetical protein BH11MYX2_BH11MYX2_12850 [soil metagenome]